MEKAKIIKRYQNRKLYDTDASCYVTLDEIAEMIMRGEEVTVIDNRSKKDITSLTLTQIIFEQEKKQSGFLPRPVLTGLVQAGGETLSALRSAGAEARFYRADIGTEITSVASSRP